MVNKARFDPGTGNERTDNGAPQPQRRELQ
nr:MAG TPA: hypothetical protein [Caudoviricetes sp.]